MLKAYWYEARHREDGATATEYIVLLVFIALAIFVGALILGGGLNQLFQDSCDELYEQAAASPGLDVGDCPPAPGGGEPE